MDQHIVASSVRAHPLQGRAKETHYKVLGVSFHSTTGYINKLKALWLTLCAREDMNSETRAEIMLQINLAASVLTDPQLRRAYNSTLSKEEIESAKNMGPYNNLTPSWWYKMPKDVTDISQNNYLIKNCLAQIDDVWTSNEIPDGRRIFNAESHNFVPQSHQRLSMASLCHNVDHQAPNISLDVASNTSTNNHALARIGEYIDDDNKVRDELSKRVRDAQEKFRIVDEKYVEIQEHYMMMKEERRKVKNDLQDALCEEKSFEMKQIKSSREQIEQEMKSKLENLRAAEKAIKQKYDRQDTTLRLSENHIQVVDDDSLSHVVSFSEEGSDQADEDASEDLDANSDDEENEVGVEDEWSEQEIRVMVSLYDSNVPLDKMLSALKRKFGTTRTMQQCNKKYEEKAAEIWQRKRRCRDDGIQSWIPCRRLRPRKKQNYRLRSFFEA